MSSYFFAVVGPSGSGKDSLMDGARAQLPKDQFVFAKRVVTRSPGQVGEDYESATPDEFSQRQARGEFLVTWQAHGFDYGLKAELADQQRRGVHVVANCSRAAIARLAQAVDRLVVLEVWAEPAVLAQRLAHRGRETAKEIELRLARAGQPLPANVPVIRVSNNDTLAAGVHAFLAAIRQTLETQKTSEHPRS